MVEATCWARSARKSKSSVLGSRSSPWRRMSRIAAPTAPAPGSRVVSTSWPRLRSSTPTARIAVLFPAPSGPSNVTNTRGCYSGASLGVHQGMRQGFGVLGCDLGLASRAVVLAAALQAARLPADYPGLRLRLLPGLRSLGPLGPGAYATNRLVAG